MAFHRVGWLASVVFCGVLPTLTIVGLFVSAVRDDAAAMDFGQFYQGAKAILHGESPYPPADYPLIASARPYIYPPLPAIAAMPLTVLPLHVVEVLVMTALLLVALAIPYVLGVRDWRCYGVALLWPPVLSAIQTSNVTLVLALACALAWRFRDRPPASSVALGVTLAVKFVLWPVVFWFAATRRAAAAVLTCAIAAGLLVVSWGAIGFDGFLAYPALLRRLEHTVGKDSYTTTNLMLDLGAAPSMARAVWLTLGLGLLALTIVLARRGDERSAFIVATTAALALSPLVWLHYFALLLVPVALVQPRLGVMWCVPLAMFVATGTGTPSMLETSVTLAAAATTAALALRASIGAPVARSRSVASCASDPEPAPTAVPARVT